MHIHIISIFPEIFDNFISTSLIKKAQEKKILKFSCLNPRQFCLDKHQQVDDTIYGGGAGLLMKAKPAIEAVEAVLKSITAAKAGQESESQKSKKTPSFKIQNSKFKILLLSPSKTIFNQKIAHDLAEFDHLIFVCTRYEGIDYRFEKYMKKQYGKAFEKVSLGQFITLGGEVPAMMMIEAITRLIPGVIKEEASRQEESYSVKEDMKNLEYPQYTHPDEVLGMKVPKVLLSGHHKNIQEWRKEKTKILSKKK